MHVGGLVLFYDACWYDDMKMLFGENTFKMNSISKKLLKNDDMMHVGGFYFDMMHADMMWSIMCSRCCWRNMHVGRWTLVHVTKKFHFLFMYAYAYDAFVYEILLRRAPLADNIGPRYSMLDYAFDKGHRARFIENGVVSNMKEILIKVFKLMKISS